MTDLNKANLQDLYPLSPMQQGILFHALYQPSGDAYFEQISYDIRGDLDIDLFKQSWQLLHNRHDALRSVFVYKKTAKLLQMVLKHREVDFNCIDLDGLAPDQQVERIEQYRQQDRVKGFVLAKDRLSRIQLFKTDANRYAMIWSFHHIILDAWCFGIIYQELMRCYQSLLYNQPLRLAPAPPYSRYIQWLSAQDKDAARDFWQNYLQGYDVAVSLYGQQQQSDDYCYATQKLILSKQDSDRLRAVARTAQVTLNTVVQTAWALLLSSHNSRNDIVFGVTVSGRPAEVINVENAVGLFINTVPLRIRIDDRLSLSALLQHVQDQALSTESYHYYSLADIQSLSELKQSLLNHVLVFENIPQVDAEDSAMQSNGFLIRQTDMFEHYHYPFSLSINPYESIELTLTYDRSVYSDIKIEHVAKQLEHLLLQISERPQAGVAELRKHLAQWLPEFMIPSRFIVSEHLPLNSNGKVDRKALVRTLGELAVPQRQYRAARNELERQAVEIWQQVLKCGPIGIDDDFFSLGGNSITAILLLSQLNKLFGKDILLSDFWRHSTISSLIEALVDDRNSVMVALNTHRDAPAVFCFPPITGFGAVFRGLAGYLLWSCYSFDIVPDIDWIAYSIAAIKQVQAHGPYVLLGYSAGGNYAYHVAAALQSQGESVQALILIDSIRVTDVATFSKQEKQDVIEQALQESQLLATIEQERVYSTMTAYLDFILQHPNRSALTADLFCLNAEDQDGLSLPSNSFSRDWSASTLGTVTNYQGEGNHFQVLTQPQLAHNAEVIQSILNKL